MLAAQCGQAERAVLVVVARGVLLAAGPEHAEVEHPHAGGQHPVPAQARLGQPADDLGADLGQPRPRASTRSYFTWSRAVRHSSW